MGTRAMIRVNGKPTFATHWDGYPTSLGVDPVRSPKDINSIMKVAADHSINFASAKYKKRANTIMLKRLKGKPGYEWIWKDGGKEFVGDIKGYDDWAEWEYNVNTKTGVVTVRELSGAWTSRTVMGKWKKLTMSNARIIEGSS